jgi:hypothetical protein
MNISSNVHIENDKHNAPYLLAASFKGIIQFNGSYTQNGVLYWQFSPKDKVLTLLEQLNAKTEPHIAAQDLFTAIETFWRQVAKARNGGMNYGAGKR